jgi:hypothetical protein
MKQKITMHTTYQDFKAFYGKQEQLLFVATVKPESGIEHTSVAVCIFTCAVNNNMKCSKIFFLLTKIIKCYSIYRVLILCDKYWLSRPSATLPHVGSRLCGPH